LSSCTRRLLRIAFICLALFLAHDLTHKPLSLADATQDPFALTGAFANESIPNFFEDDEGYTAAAESDQRRVEYLLLF